jgi:amidohydrolase
VVLNIDAERIKSKLVEMREDFHRYPELAFQEIRTSHKIAEILQEIELDEVHTQIAKTGVVGVLRGGLPGKTFALRADMDALPIQEENNTPYKSRNDGIMHACGHDVHITSVLGSAMILSEVRNELKGNVKFIFQPAEEVAGGGKAMVKAGVLSDPPKVDAIVALHVWPDIKTGTIGVKAGPAMAAMDKFQIVVRGPGGHGAMPHLTSDPIVASAQIINAIQTVVTRFTEPIQPIVLSICMIKGGSAFNIIPKQVQMEGTARTLDDKVKAEAISRIKEIIKGIEKAMDVQCEFRYMDGCPAMINDPDLIELIKRAGTDVVGEDSIVNIEPTMGGEDFTYFAREVPGAMFCLGVRDERSGFTSPVHRPTFDVDNDVLVTGVSMLSRIATMYLNE